MTDSELNKMLDHSRALMKDMEAEIGDLMGVEGGLPVKQVAVQLSAIQATLVGIHAELAAARMDRGRQESLRVGG